MATYAFGLLEAKIATLNLDGTYEAAVTVDAPRRFLVRVRTISGELEGGDEIVDTHAKIIAVQVELEKGGIDLDVLQVLAGKDYDSYGVTPNTAKMLSIGQENLPYFGLVGLASHTHGGGANVFFAPKVKIMEGFELTMQYGQYSIPSLTASGLRKTPWGFASILEYETAPDLTIPPTLPS